MIAVNNSTGINKKALLWSIGIHALLLLLFFFLRYSIGNPVSISNDSGLEVNLGTDEDGMDNNQPMKKNKPSEFKANVLYKPVASKEGIINNILKNNDASSPPVNNNNKTVVKNSTDNKIDSQKQQIVQKPLYTYGGEKGTSGNSATDDKQGLNEGNTNKPGDRGVPNGTPDAPNYSGIPGSGTGGIGHNLTGRQISPSRFEAEFKESGKVVIHVTVDRSGNIIDKRIISSSSPQLSRIALDKLKTTKFSKSESSEPQQFGDITVIFKTH